MRVLINSSTPWYISHVHTKAIDFTADTPAVNPGSQNIPGSYGRTDESFTEIPQ